MDSGSRKRERQCLKGVFARGVQHSVVLGVMVLSVLATVGSVNAQQGIHRLENLVYGSGPFGTNKNSMEKGLGYGEMMDYNGMISKQEMLGEGALKPVSSDLFSRFGGDFKESLLLGGEDVGESSRYNIPFRGEYLPHYYESREGLHTSPVLKRVEGVEAIGAEGMGSVGGSDDSETQRFYGRQVWKQYGWTPRSYGPNVWTPTIPRVYSHGMLPSHNSRSGEDVMIAEAYRKMMGLGMSQQRMEYLKSMIPRLRLSVLGMMTPIERAEVLRLLNMKERFELNRIMSPQEKFDLFWMLTPTERFELLIHLKPEERMELIFSLSPTQKVGVFESMTLLQKVELLRIMAPVEKIEMFRSMPDVVKTQIGRIMSHQELYAICGSMSAAERFEFFVLLKPHVRVSYLLAMTPEERAAAIAPLSSRQKVLLIVDAISPETRFELAKLFAVRPGIEMWEGMSPVEKFDTLRSIPALQRCQLLSELPVQQRVQFFLSLLPVQRLQILSEMSDMQKLEMLGSIPIRELAQGLDLLSPAERYGILRVTNPGFRREIARFVRQPKTFSDTLREEEGLMQARTHPRFRGGGYNYGVGQEVAVA